MQDNEYYSIKNRLSASGMKYLDDSPLMYQKYIQNGVEVTEAMKQGTFLHACLLEPHLVPTKFRYLSKDMLPFPESNFQNKANREFKNAFLKDCEQKGLVAFEKEEDYKNVLAVSETVNNNPIVKAILKDCEFEVPHLWEQPETGALMKGKADIVKPSKRFVADIKKVPNLHPRMFEKTAYERFMHVQAVTYLEMCSLKYGVEFQDYFIIGVDVDNQLCNVFRFDVGALDFAREKYLKLCQLYKDCTETNDWYGYEKDARYSHDGTGIISLGIPNWAYYN
jgi:hypothetical protein